ncbi:hypothetical protein [Pseudomonas purpurea]|uniref:hypothetical protein n=1 Tax=Pseudomonas purpurea TaxID=3136737 RepID=UPI0032636032
MTSRKKPTPPASRRDARLFLGFAAALAVMACLIAFTVADGLMHGAINSMTRFGPKTLYTLAEDARMYRFTLIWHSVIAGALLILAGVSFQVSRALAPDRKP